VFALSRRSVTGNVFADLFVEGRSFGSKLSQALDDMRGFFDQELTLTRPGYEPLHLNCVLTPVDMSTAALLIEFRHIEQQLRIERETQRLTQHEANRELIRNLAHEIKNPLGGIRGSAQLLERELERTELREYTQVIINEADRLQALLDRLLTPHRRPQMGAVNIHEVCERVRTLIRRDYDTAFGHCDVVCTPTTPTPAFALGEKTGDPLEMYLADIFTLPPSLAGLPAISTPCGLSSDGLPIGLQLVAPPFEEEVLCTVSQAVEDDSGLAAAHPTALG